VLKRAGRFGEIVDVCLVRDAQTGKSRGFAFVAYEDQRSTTLAVDNFNGAKVLGRVLRVDHKAGYRPPKRKEDEPVNEAVEEAKRRALSLDPQRACAPAPLRTCVYVMRLRH
jgi:RNA-binding motif protein, X-linked 2